MRKARRAYVVFILVFGRDRACKRYTPLLPPPPSRLTVLISCVFFGLRTDESLAMSMANNSIDIISAVYSSQRLILAELIRGVSPVSALRWPSSSLRSTRTDALVPLSCSRRLLLHSNRSLKGTQGWYQPLLLLRRSVKALMGERAVAGELPPGPLSFTAIYLITYPLWFEVLASISLRE